MDPNQGQGMANGIRGLARGVGDFSNVMLQLANKKAEAKNYSDVTAARNQMLQIEGEFDQWRLQNPDPEGWESKWGEMSASARGRVTETKGLSPAAIERIGQEFEDFNVRQTINVGTMAVKGHVAKARYAVFYVATSLGWDVPRSVLTAVLILIAGRSMLATWILSGARCKWHRLRAGCMRTTR